MAYLETRKVKGQWRYTIEINGRNSTLIIESDKGYNNRLDALQIAKNLIKKLEKDNQIIIQRE